MDQLQEEQQRYQAEVRARAAQLIRDEGLPLFDAMDKAQQQIATERVRAATRRRFAKVFGIEP